MLIPLLFFAFLFLELAAEFITRPQNQEVVEGEAVEFSCSVSKETYEVKWFRSDKEVETGDKYTVVSEGKRRALTVKNCDLKDEGGYVAHIGSIKASADLSVIGEDLSTSCFFAISEQHFGFSKFVISPRKTEDHNTD